jgi:hypothetical protein
MQRIFSALNGTATFTQYSTKRTYDLTEYLKRKIPSLAATRWSCSSRLVNVIDEHRILILEYFGSTEEEEGRSGVIEQYRILILEYFRSTERQKEWSANDKMAARSF